MVGNIAGTSHPRSGVYPMKLQKLTAWGKRCRHWSSLGLTTRQQVRKDLMGNRKYLGVERSLFSLFLFSGLSLL